MKYFILLLALAVTGCNSKPYVTLCNGCGAKGFEYRVAWGWNCGAQTHCIPCTEAKSPEARFVCFGEVPK